MGATDAMGDAGPGAATTEEPGAASEEVSPTAAAKSAAETAPTAPVSLEAPEKAQAAAPQTSNVDNEPGPAKAEAAPPATERLSPARAIPPPKKAATQKPFVTF